MSGRINPRQLAAMLRADAQKMGISVEELIKRIMGGGQDVVGHLGAGTIPQGPTYVSAEGGGVWNNIAEAGEPQDDFEELAQKHSQLLEEAGGDDLARDVLLRDHVALPFADNAVHTNPKSAIGSVLGNSALITTDQQPLTLAYWAGDDPEATNVTVTLAPGAATPQAGGIPIDIDPFARITWGTRANQLTTDVDIGRGCQFTVSASSVILQVGLNSVPAGAGVATMLMSGFLSFRQITHQVPITRTLFATIQAGADTQFVIPNFAKQFRVFRSNAAEAITITVQGYVGQRIYSVLKTASGTQDDVNMDPLELTRNSAFVDVKNTGAAPTDVYVIFDLSL